MDAAITQGVNGPAGRLAGPFSFWCDRCNYSPILIGYSPGRLVGLHPLPDLSQVRARRPRHPAAALIPESYRARLRCTKCGGRGADIQIRWATPSAPPQASAKSAGGQVVYLTREKFASPRRGGSFRLGAMDTLQRASGLPDAPGGQARAAKGGAGVTRAGGGDQRVCDRGQASARNAQQTNAVACPRYQPSEASAGCRAARLTARGRQRMDVL
jgi:hypothetical protein